MQEVDWVTPGFTDDGWTVVQGPDANSLCAGVRLFGGYQLWGRGTYIQKTFTLPPHQKVRVQLQFWKIDSWDNERAALFANDREVWAQNFVSVGY